MERWERFDCLRLEALAIALLDFSTAADLEHWLAEGRVESADRCN
jgi:Domain of unknown function (DUF4351)